MAMYSLRTFRIYTEFDTSTLVVCYTYLYAFMCYISMFNIGLLYCNSGVCSGACSSLLHVGHHASGSGGARVVIMAASVVLGAVRSTLGGHIPRYVRVGVWVVTALYICCIPPREFAGVGGT
jgi:hypothetical protein